MLVEANDPVAFFAYPDRPSLLKSEGCEVHRMTESGENWWRRWRRWPWRSAPSPRIETASHGRFDKTDRRLEPSAIAQAIAVADPENAIMVDDSSPRRAVFS